MAATHYAYRCMKIPGPMGVITLQANAEASLECDKKRLDMGIHQQQGEETKNWRPKVGVKSADYTKLVPLNSSEPSKSVRIGSNLNSEIGRRARHLPPDQHGRVCMATVRHVQYPQGGD